MKIRELLQIEIWSKRTSRKIYFGLGLLVLVAVLVECSFVGINDHWLTPAERLAARAALDELDSLQNSGSLSNRDFSARTKQAEASVDEAGRVARTKRDRMIVADLMAYQLDIVVKRVLIERHELIERRNSGFADTDRKINELVKSSGMNENSDRSKLHKELD